jgi:broad specificity phosphatase PhoE
MPATLLLVRHAEAEHNAAFQRGEGESAFQDPAYEDAPLTGNGLIQARDLAKTLASYRILDIWSSPLTRCIQTATEIFGKTSAHRITLHDNLLERLGGGHICNARKTKTELKTLYDPIVITKYLAETPASWEERETEYALRQRLWMLCALLKDLYSDESGAVVIVSHSDAIRALTGKSLRNAESLTLTWTEIHEK